MAPIQQEAEIQFAQRLASNEKPMRTKAIKKLRKYISVRSQKINSGFTGDELLKLWKGLFYCLWMQDKPLLQEELSNQISGLMHSFQNVQSKFLFLETFLHTIKREWTGIDRLRMDTFFQLVRFVFRNTFEMMKRKEWETSVVTRFLELLTAQILHSTSGAPCGLQFHILDLYMTELAAVGSAENLTFIDPLCKTASKTKDRILLKAICSSIFSAIVDEAPFAIEDLLKEVKATGGGSEESDSGQASEEGEEEEEKKKPPKGKKAAKKSPMKTTGKQTNCTVSTKEEDEDSLEDDEMLHLESDSESEIPDDGGIGPVLQFDYSALADRLFGLASRSNTPSHNRQRLYKVIKTLRDLSDGVFPQDEYPEEVSTDEDDDEIREQTSKDTRRHHHKEEEEEEHGRSEEQNGVVEESKTGVKTETSTPAEGTDVGEKVEKQEAVLEEEASPMKVTDTPTAVTAMETENQSEIPKDVVVGSLSSAKVMEMGQKTQSETPVPDSTSLSLSAPETATTSTTKRKGRRKSTKQEPEEQTTVEEVETKPDAVEVPLAEEITATPLKKTWREKAKWTAESTKEEVAEIDATPVDTTPQTLNQKPHQLWSLQLTSASPPLPEKEETKGGQV
ncbi:unnamed protein product [Coregonus sp. 'balchen']|nr:unnamed protein product [Coregonus sp. 'balchen']